MFDWELEPNITASDKPHSELSRPTTNLFYAHARFAIEPSLVLRNDLDLATQQYKSAYFEIAQNLDNDSDPYLGICNLVRLERNQRSIALMGAIRERPQAIRRNKQRRLYVQKALLELDVQSDNEFSEVINNTDVVEVNRWNNYELPDKYLRREVLAAMERLDIDMGIERRLFDNAVLPGKGHLALLNRGMILLQSPNQS